MNNHKQPVMITLANVGQWSELVAGELFEALDGDLEFGTRDGLAFVQVPLDAAGDWRDLPAVIEAIQRVLPRAVVIRAEVIDAPQTTAAA